MTRVLLTALGLISIIWCADDTSIYADILPEEIVGSIWKGPIEVERTTTDHNTDTVLYYTEMFSLLSDSTFIRVLWPYKEPKQSDMRLWPKDQPVEYAVGYWRRYGDDVIAYSIVSHTELWQTYLQPELTMMVDGVRFTESPGEHKEIVAYFRGQQYHRIIGQKEKNSFREFIVVADTSWLNIVRDSLSD